MHDGYTERHVTVQSIRLATAKLTNKKQTGKIICDILFLVCRYNVVGHVTELSFRVS